MPKKDDHGTDRDPQPARGGKAKGKAGGAGSRGKKPPVEPTKGESELAAGGAKKGPAKPAAGDARAAGASKQEGAGEATGKRVKPSKSADIPPEDLQPLTKETRPSLGFPVVGLGASAGGLEALASFLDHLPEDLNAALVVVLHEDPTSKSYLTGLLERHTSLEVGQIEDGDRPQARRVHICPPGRLLGLEKGRFRVKDRREKGPLATVDYFFHSLALEMETDCAGIVLSGTGSDGSQGVRDIKQGGGLVMVQDGDSAAYSGMPDAARRSGAADYVLPPEEMPAILARYFVRSTNQEEDQAEVGNHFKQVATKIYFQVKQQTGHDFSDYKASTMRRRVERRMSLHNLDDLHDYVALLRKDPREVSELFHELLIGVTSFFRDPEAWESLKNKFLLPQLRKMEKGRTFRAWATGCSSGEEAYSLAILVWECLKEEELDLGIQIFGTDIDSKAIERAREGRFPSSIAGDLDPGRLKRFFRQENDDYLVRKDIRDCLVFSEQDVLRDPPFSRLDLLICRNLLIYLMPEAQSRLLPLFHYTLREGGALFLGSSESLGRHNNLFESLDNTWKIYRKHYVSPSARPALRFPTGKAQSARGGSDSEGARTGSKGQGGRRDGRQGDGPAPGLAERTKEALLSRFVPAAVVVNRQGDISYVHGRTGKYLEPAPGHSSLNLFAMAREGMRSAVINLINRTAEELTNQVARGLTVRTNGDAQEIDLVAAPLEGHRDSDQFLVVFQDVAEPRKAEPRQRRQDQDGGGRIRQLEKELQSLRESHQTTIEELESSNEELRSTNEELQSTNEELQSTNEELESSREELQSMNEELTTVNNELRSKLDDLALAQDDMNNLLNATHVATLFLDKEMNIRRFTQEAAELINLRNQDVGRPLQDLTTKLDYDEMAAEARRVLKSLESSQREISDHSGNHYRVNIRPYRTVEDKIDGLVITFVNISELRDALEKARYSQLMAESVVDTVREPLLVLDGGLRVISANHSFFEFFATSERDTVGQRIYDLGNGQWNIPELRRLLEEIIPERTTFEAYPVEHEFPSLGKRRMLLNARRLEMKQAGEERILLAMEEEPGSDEGEAS